MGTQKKIKAMKGELVGFFSETDWRVGNPEKHGWRKVGEANAIDPIIAHEIQAKKEIIEVEIPKEDEVVKEVVKEDVVEEVKEVVEKPTPPTVEQARKYLEGLADAGKIKRPHHKLGDKKIMELYESTKQKDA